MAVITASTIPVKGVLLLSLNSIPSNLKRLSFSTIIGERPGIFNTTLSIPVSSVAIPLKSNSDPEELFTK